MHKVLALVSFKIYPAQMGGQKGVALFYAYLKKHFKITIAATRNNEQSGVENFLFPNRFIFLNFFRIGRLQKIIEEREIDVIIAEHSYTGWLARQLSKRTGKPFIIHSHNIEALRFKQMSRWWWTLYEKHEARMHRKADHNFFISNEDREYALTQFHLDPAKCSVITYGTEYDSAPEQKQNLHQELGLDADTILFLFNGTLDYQPNYEAVVLLEDKIEPLLQSQIKNYRIVITGKNAPGALVRKMEANGHFIYQGFVEKPGEYYRASTLFLNPIVNNSGIKTKLVEAIAHNCTVISFEGGAAGMDRSACGEKLVTVADHDFEKFAAAIKTCSQKDNPATPGVFYETYSWTNIAARAADIIEKVIQKK